MKKYVSAIALIGLFFVIAANTNEAIEAPEGFQNLKVLPKNISHEKLDSIMGVWSVSLGVRCNFCHAANADTTIRRLDFASDAKEEKEAARYMYKMTIEINNTYMNPNHSPEPEALTGVVCYTCHRGNAHPEGKAFAALVDSTLKSYRKK